MDFLPYTYHGLLVIFGTPKCQSLVLIHNASFFTKHEHKIKIFSQNAFVVLTMWSNYKAQHTHGGNSLLIVRFVVGFFEAEGLAGRFRQSRNTY